jgi:hypothetical protein
MPYRDLDEMAPDGLSLLTLSASSVQTAPDGYRRIVWMIIGMIKSHPTEIGWQGERTGQSGRDVRRAARGWSRRSVARFYAP